MNLSDPGRHLEDEVRVDLVVHLRLAVEDFRAGGFEHLPRLAAPLDADHRIQRAVADRDRRQRRRQVELEPLDGRDERAEHGERRRSRPPAAQAQRIRHHAALREPAQHQPVVPETVLRQEAVQPLRCRRVAQIERRRLGRADPTERVPVRAAGRQRQRPARRRADETALRVQRIEQGKEIVLVRAAPVEQDQRALWLAGRRPQTRSQRHAVDHDCRGTVQAAMRFEGIHHITCITGDAPGNVDFYVRVLGLRLVKKSVNQDDPTVYHLFYADEKGSAGSDLTFFEYPHARRGRAGAGMVHRIVFRVASDEALDFWEERLTARERPDSAAPRPAFASRIRRAWPRDRRRRDRRTSR